MTILDNDLVRAVQADRAAGSLRNEVVLQARGAVGTCERTVGDNHAASLITRIVRLFERPAGRFFARTS
jgi:hypothetical protein